MGQFVPVYVKYFLSYVLRMFFIIEVLKHSTVERMV